MNLEVGKKYKLPDTVKGEWYKILYLGKEKFFLLTNKGDEGWDYVNRNWLPYEEPTPDDTKLWYWEFKYQGQWEQRKIRETQKDINFCDYDEYRKLEALGFIEKEEK